MYLEALSLGDTDPQREKRQSRNKGFKSNLYFKEKDIKRLQSSSLKIENRKLLNV